METIYSIFSSFDCNPTLETRVVFLDISKVFDKVWHKGLLFKLESMGIFGDLLNLMESFLSERFQRGLCSCQSSKWVSIKADVPLSSILGSCFFLIYINDLSDSITSNKKPFLMTLISQQVILVLISRRYLNVLLNRKFILIHSLPNKLRK